MAELIVATFSFLAGVIGIWFTYASWKTKELRNDEIFEWSMTAIDILQRTYRHIVALRDSSAPRADAALFFELHLQSSVMVEKGRMFFRNVNRDDTRDGPNAYQGRRPIILDCLVANSQICQIAPGLHDQPSLAALARISERYTRQFIDLAQQEVGRSKAPLSGAAAAGTGVDVRGELALALAAVQS